MDEQKTVPREQLIAVADLCIGDLLKIAWKAGGWGRVLEMNRLSATTVVRVEARGRQFIVNLTEQCRVLR